MFRLDIRILRWINRIAPFSSTFQRHPSPKAPILHNIFSLVRQTDLKRPPVLSLVNVFISPFLGLLALSFCQSMIDASIPSIQRGTRTTNPGSVSPDVLSDPNVFGFSV